MLEIQRWLIQNNSNYKLLEEQLGIKANFHEDGRVILNYSQIDSPKLNPIVREARGLVLDREHNLVAKSFSRFFNWNEGTKAEMDSFDWKNCKITHKEDGSLLLLYYWLGQWHINTRNSYGDGLVNDSGYTWKDIFKTASRNFEFYDKLDENLAYTFELCSLYNQVVKVYPEPKLFLLSAFHGEEELTHDTVEAIASDLRLARPETVVLNDPLEVASYIAAKASIEKGFEGTVARDSKNVRFKQKTESYLLLHRLSNNGLILSTKNLVATVLKGEEDEMITYFPFIKDRVLEIKCRIHSIEKDLDNVWYTYCMEESRKKFAEAVKTHPFSALLFGIYGKEYKEVSIRHELTKFKDKITEYIEATRPKSNRTV